ncbi:tetratricopeptide repeat protein [Candidatus Woesearchaeota archaeon]|nr:tetratricopeptide repeat protein [Candidatus Woesearchaeota archaeon]
MTETLVEYIREQLQNGFTIDQIRDYLIRYGYHEQDVNIAVDAAMHGIDTHPIVQQVPIHKHPLAMKIMIILAVVTVSLAVFMYFSRTVDEGMIQAPMTEGVTPVIFQPEPETPKIPKNVQDRIDNVMKDLQNAEKTQNSYQQRVDYLDNAIVNLRVIIDEEPNSADAHNFLADALEAKGLYDEAESEYRVAMELDPDNPELYNDLGYLYARKGDMSTATQYYNNAIAKDPTFDVAYSNLGMYYYETGNYDEAIRNFVIAKELKSYNYKTINNLGFAYLKKGMHERALAEFRESLKINPDFPNPYFGIGLVFMEQQQYDKAVYELEKSIVLDPSNFIYQEAYARAKKSLEV